MGVDVSAARLSPEEVLELLPQREPFRFVDEILEVDEDHIVACYRFRPDADFYRGHFPGDPITPGVILLESLAQVGVVALGIYIYALQYGREGVKKRIALFTDASIDFSGIVKPGERVTTTARKTFFSAASSGPRPPWPSTTGRWCAPGRFRASGSSDEW